MARNDVYRKQATTTARGLTHNDAGGVGYTLSPWGVLRRFLILGTADGTYYVKATKMTDRATLAIRQCIIENPRRVADMVKEVSDGGLAAHNTPAIYVLAMMANLHNDDDWRDIETRKEMERVFQSVIRVPTHLFEFLSFHTRSKGCRLMGRVISDWYNRYAHARDLAFHMIKYQQREGWSHRDVLRLAHPYPKNDAISALFAWAVGRDVDALMDQPFMAPIKGHRILQQEGLSIADVCAIIRDYQMPREAVPTEYLRESAVWEALLPNLGLTGILRSLRVMLDNGTLARGECLNFVCDRIVDESGIYHARVHPMQYLLAMGAIRRTNPFYMRDPHAFARHTHGDPDARNPFAATGEGIDQLMGALEHGFYTAFGTVEPTNKRLLLALDCSGSMTYNVFSPGVTCGMLATLMAMVTVRTEPELPFIIGYATMPTEIPITKDDTLGEALYKWRSVAGGGTDCSVPWRLALQLNRPFDAIVTYSDGEDWYRADTWRGNRTTQTVQAEQERYRNRLGLQTRSVVAGFTATDFTLLDPNDGLNLNVVGFDASGPQGISEFVREGNIL